MTLIDLGGNTYINPEYIVEIIDEVVEMVNGQYWTLTKYQMDMLLEKLKEKGNLIC